MDLLYALTTIIFASLFILRQVQYNRLKRYNTSLEKELNAVRYQQNEYSYELALSNTEIAQKPLDHLTGLPSREAFDDRLHQALLHSKRYQNPMALISLNVDNFHLVNQHGYEVGDALLKQLANRLLSCVRQVDTVCRYAGNNFFILLPQINKPEITSDVVKRIQDSIIPPFIVSEHVLYITTSMGIAIAPTDGETTETLMHHASVALQLAQAKGRNTYQFFRSDIQRLSEKEVAITQCLRSDDLFNYLSFTLHPQVLVSEMKIIYVHMQAYLDLPKYEQITSQEFLRMAEKIGVDTEISQWLLVTGLKQINTWYEEGLAQPKAIIINVTMNQIENPQFIRQIADAALENNPHHVELIFEINQDYLVETQVISDKAVAALNAEKIKLAIGVYTFGQFALQKMTNLPVQYLKINAALIERHESIIKFIVQAMQNSDINLIAEGVDEENQKVALQNIGCTIMEGKLFDHLLPQKIPASVIV